MLSDTQTLDRVTAADIVRSVRTLTPDVIRSDNQGYMSVKENIESLNRLIQDARKWSTESLVRTAPTGAENLPPESIRAKHIEAITERMEQMQQAMSHMRRHPCIFELRNEDPKATGAKITAILSSMTALVNVNKPITGQQIAFLAEMILHEYGSLTLEELAMIMHNGVKGVYGESYHRMDVEVVTKWIETYWSERVERAAAANAVPSSSTRFGDPNPVSDGVMSLSGALGQIRQTYKELRDETGSADRPDGDTDTDS